MAWLTLYPHAEATGSSAPALSVDLLAIVVAVVAFIVSGLFLLILVPERAEAPGPDRATAASGTGFAVAGTAPAALSPGEDGAPAGEDAARHLPVEHDGATHLLPVASIVAVHANAHYTYVFDGTHKYFCPLAIGDVEARLDPARFARVHRSHIIAIDRVVRVKKTGDNGLVELAGEDAYTVPVSRGRLAWVRSHLGTRAHAAAS